MTEDQQLLRVTVITKQFASHKLFAAGINFSLTCAAIVLFGSMPCAIAESGDTGAAKSTQQASAAAEAGSAVSTETPKGADIHASGTLIADTSAIVPGQKFRVGLQLVMQPGWHTYYKEPGDAGMPTRITWSLPAGFTASDLEWEKPHKFVDSSITTYGYENQTLIGATITPPADLKPAQKIKISAKVKWLTCKDVCVPGGGSIVLTMDSAEKAQAENAEAFAKLGFNSPVSQIASETGALAPAVAVAAAGSSFKGSIIDANFKVADSGNEKLSLAAYLGLAFIGGFILNFMPCVLPVISIKVLSFMQQAGDDPKRVFRLGMTFTAGIVSSFLALAGAVVAVQAAGAKVGWGFQFQFPVFLLGMSAVVLMFALSLFGLFYIQVSAGQDQIDKLASKEGYTGTFFKGVLATTLSTPCSAPFLGTALGFAFSQPAWVVFLIFLTISIGMSFPYVLLTAQPAWMKYIPKPGVWMEKFKESMGFLLLATVVWLMWVLGQQVGLTATMAAVGFLIALSFAVWIVGRFTDLSSSNKRKGIVYAIVACVMVGSYSALLAPFPQLLSMSPVQAGETEQASATTLVSTTSGGSANADAIKWIPFSVERLNEQLKAGKTVFIDFTADWCLTCKANETGVINTAPVREKLHALNVVTMRADWTKQDPEIYKLLQKFGRSGVPLYVIFPASRPTQPIVLPEVITTGLVVSKLAEAGPSQ
jgi:thiol:disulfide interchange protein